MHLCDEAGHRLQAAPPGLTSAALPYQMVIVHMTCRVCATCLILHAHSTGQVLARDKATVANPFDECRKKMNFLDTSKPILRQLYSSSCSSRIEQLANQIQSRGWGGQHGQSSANIHSLPELVASPFAWKWKMWKTTLFCEIQRVEAPCDWQSSEKEMTKAALGDWVGGG